jgi:hypothetical protein
MQDTVVSVAQIHSTKLIMVLTDTVVLLQYIKAIVFVTSVNYSNNSI